MFGRFEAEAPNVLWVADVLHGPLIGGRKTYLVAFLDDHSRLFPVTQDEHEDDAQDEQVEPDIPGAGSAVRAHGGAVVLTVTR